MHQLEICRRDSFCASFLTPVIIKEAWDIITCVPLMYLPLTLLRQELEGGLKGSSLPKSESNIFKGQTDRPTLPGPFISCTHINFYFFSLPLFFVFFPTFQLLSYHIVLFPSFFIFIFVYSFISSPSSFLLNHQAPIICILPSSHIVLYLLSQHFRIFLYSTSSFPFCLYLGTHHALPAQITGYLSSGPHRYTPKPP